MDWWDSGRNNVPTANIVSLQSLHWKAIFLYGNNQVTNGNMQLQLRPTIDYTVNQRLNVQLYFNRTISDPKISTSFKNTVTEGGVQIRYSLSQ